MCISSGKPQSFYQSGLQQNYRECQGSFINPKSTIGNILQKYGVNKSVLFQKEHDVVSKETYYGLDNKRYIARIDN